MALLRLSNGRVYTAIEDINRFVAPMTIGKFKVTDETLAKVAAFPQPLSHADAMFVYDSLDPEAIRMVEAEGFTYRRVGDVVPAEDGSFQFMQRSPASDPAAPPVARSPKDIADYLIPHYVQVNDWHFVFSGSIIKGVKFSDDLQGIAYIQAGEWVRLNPTILNWPVFPYGQATVAVSCFDRPFDKPFQMDLHREEQVLPEMAY